MEGKVTTVMKLCILVVMVLTGSLYSILLRYTRISSQEKYITTSAVAIQEVIKLFLAVITLIWQSKGVKNAFVTFKLEAIDKPSDTLKMSVPSFAYAIQNNMTYIALSNLDVPIQQILYQLKIPITAFCSILILGKSLTKQQWVAVFLVFTGLVVVEYRPDNHHVVTDPKPETEFSSQNYLLGVAAVLVAVFCSAFAGVYFEKMVKGSETSLWVRNIQMYMWTILASFLALFSNNWDEVMEKGMFNAYTPYLWLLLCIGGVNGLIVSLVLKFTDNIVKCFAASTSIILSTAASYFLFQYQLDAGFIIGGSIVCTAILLYGIPLPCGDDSK